MYAKIGKFWCLWVFMEGGVQLWSGIQNTVDVCHRLHRAAEICKGVSGQATLKTK